MSKARVVVLEVTSGHLTVTAAARAYGLSRQHIYRLLKRYQLGGLDAVEPGSRRPASNPRAVPDDVIAAVVLLREKLTSEGLDAGPLTLQTHLAAQGLHVPSTATIRRILHHHGLITPQPRKRPKSSYHRFAADQPNECWQSDFTHWTLADGTEVEILNWLDDHSRYLLACTAYPRVTGPDVVASFTATAIAYGLPASTLTDNAAVYTSRFTHGHNDFERLLAALGITQKTATPTTHKPKAKSNASTKPSNAGSPPDHDRALSPNSKACSTPSAPFTTRNEPTAPTQAEPPQNTPTKPDPKPTPTAKPSAHLRIRHDTVDNFGKLTLRHGSRLHHLGIGAAHAHTPVLILVADPTVTVISKTGHHILSSHHIDPAKNYWRNQQKNPGRWPGNL
jgi:transposase